MIRGICNLARGCVAIASAACVLGADTASPLVIQLRVVEGEGASYAAGSRATRGLSIRVTDETGNAVDGAAVSFQLPAEGPSGAFPGGGKTTIVTTKGGIASVWGMQWNRITGTFNINVTASKGQARASIVVPQNLSDAKTAGGEGTFTASHHSGRKWLVIAAIGAGAAAGVALRGASAKAPAPAAPPAALQIGNPTIIVGHP